jgi:peptidoglycan biosynthesis protein MviN/MurJ (putative lipid II flippase)
MMTEATQGILIHAFLSIGAALGVHAVSKRYFLASGAAAILANVGFQALSYFHEGHFEKLLLIALLMGGIISFGIALVAGVPFVFYCRPRTLI